MLCDNLEGCDGVGGGREFEREGTCAYRWLIHVDLRQKPTQHCKAIILQFKINKFFKKEGQTNKQKRRSPSLSSGFKDPRAVRKILKFFLLEKPES